MEHQPHHNKTTGMSESLRIDYLDAMGVAVWQRKELGQLTDKKIKRAQVSEVSKKVEQKRVETPATDPAPVAKSSVNKLESTDWAALRQAVSACQACQLAQGRTQTVFGVGNQQADLVIVGEAPGFHEDRQGEPFVGRAGKLLDEMLKAIGLNRAEHVYIANVLKCRPPKNRDPSPEEVATCTPFLQRQLSLLKPKLIMAVGRVSANYLLGKNASLASMRGREMYYPELDIPLIVTYHPAYLLRNPRDKAKAYADLQLVARLLS